MQNFFVFIKVFLKQREEPQDQSDHAKMKSRLSVCNFPRHAHDFAISPRINSGFARNESHVFWHQLVCFEKFLTAAVCRRRCFECQGVDDFCGNFTYIPAKPQPRHN